MAKAEKVEKVATLKERIEGSEALLLADYRGLTVVETKDLRTSLREADAAFAVVKNTLMKRAAGESGMDVLDPLLEGPTAVAFVRGDAVLAAKRLSEATRRFPTLDIKGGFMEGRLLSAEEPVEDAQDKQSGWKPSLVRSDGIQPTNAASTTKTSGWTAQPPGGRFPEARASVAEPSVQKPLWTAGRVEPVSSVPAERGAQPHWSPFR